MLKYTLPAVPMTATTNAAARQLAAQLLGKWPVFCSSEVESVISFQSFEADYNWLMPTAHSGESNWLTEKWGQKKEGR